MEFGKESWRTYKDGISREWLLTNGIGGFASSTLIGASSRRYHSLLTAALHPPAQRHLVLAKLDESIRISDRSYNLYSFRTGDGYLMEGFMHLLRFTMNPLPLYIYSVEDVFIEKEICMVYGENTTAVVYRISAGSATVSLKLTPLVNFRDYHGNSTAEGLEFTQDSDGNKVMLRSENNEVCISLYCSDGIYQSMDNCYFYNMYYDHEGERGLNPVEDHYIPGTYEIVLKPGETKVVTFLASVEECPDFVDGPLLLDREKNRINKLTESCGYKDEFIKSLVAAADNFIVYRKSTGRKTIIAGYPWFTDWGRDTMIAFAGLTLSTGRYEDAREILLTFSTYIKNGLLPNMFPDHGIEPLYNTVDAALWYFEAVAKYIEYTDDYDFVEKNIYMGLKSIISSYISGTEFNIGMDQDGLIQAGNEDIQLTWMDAKIGDWVITPRHGKAVEVNALWYNALVVAGSLAERFNEDHIYYEDLAKQVKESFLKAFWNEKDKYLYDVVTPDHKDDRVRPNQILAVSLSHPVIEGDKARMVVQKVWSELYTAYGLRSLSQNAAEYKGACTGSQYMRDSAYHQGTVWAWLMGHFVTGFSRVFGDTKNVIRFLEPFMDHMKDACVGQISEIFDGNEPFYPRGCFAQAWSVAEILRAYSEHVCTDS